MARERKTKTVCGLRNPEVVAIVKEIGVRKRNVFIEYAILNYYPTKEGQRVYNAVRKPARPGAPSSAAPDADAPIGVERRSSEAPK